MRLADLLWLAQTRLGLEPFTGNGRDSIPQHLGSDRGR
jgi:hypothetical protein